MNFIAQNLGKTYNQRKIVKDFSISFSSGEVVGLLGPNGAGKSTSFYMLAGIIKPDHGKIILNDNDITGLELYQRARIGLSYLPQESSAFASLTVWQNIAAVLEISDYDESSLNNRVEKLLQDLNLLHLAEVKAIALSGGERRRMEIARCLATKPQYLLLDEPLAGVDPIAVNEIKSIIQSLRKKQIGILITDHNVREALDTVDRAYVMYDGQVIAEGTPDLLANNEMVKQLYLGEKFTL